jgi:transmembrane sensor
MTSASDDIEEQAARWLIRLDSEGTPEHWAQLDGWLAGNPRHRAAFLRISAAWRKADQARALRARLPQPVPLLRFAFGFRTALACGLALVATGIAMHFPSPRATTQTYSTQVGELERLSLPDGSTIVLNTDSELRVRYSRDQRTLTLVRGEAAFRVARDPLRPFDVHAGTATVRVLGTAFSVRLKDPGTVTVGVTEGRVAINPPSATVLAAGDLADVRGATVMRRNVPTELLVSRLSWMHGKLTFTGETLAEAVAEFNRYHPRRFVIDDPRIAGLHLSGVFVAKDVEAIAAGLERTFGIRALPEPGSGPRSGAGAAAAGTIHLVGKDPG